MFIQKAPVQELALHLIQSLSLCPLPSHSWISITSATLEYFPFFMSVTYQKTKSAFMLTSLHPEPWWPLCPLYLWVLSYFIPPPALLNIRKSLFMGSWSLKSKFSFSFCNQRTSQWLASSLLGEGIRLNRQWMSGVSVAPLFDIGDTYIVTVH